MSHHIGYVVNYQLIIDGVILYFNSGASLIVYFDQNTGRPVKRKKRDTLTGVWHTGLWLGSTSDGTSIIAHNHILVGRPSFATISQFGQQMKVYSDERICNQDIDLRIESVLQQIVAGRNYHLTNYNCQHFVNIACSRKRTSEVVDNFRIAASFLLLFGFVVAISK